MRLREVRKRKGWSMKQLGEYLGCSESTISLYENGKREPSFETMLRIGELFGVSVDYLLGGPGGPSAFDEENKKGPDSKEPELTDEQLKFALFGGADVTDAQFEEVKRFAQFVKHRDGTKD